MDPISLLLMAQSAVAAIRTGCQMLSEGKAEIGKFKKTVETGVADAKAIFKEVSGMWGWLQNLFGSKPTPPPAPILPSSPEVVEQTKAVRKTKREPEPELSYEEYQARAVHDICENLKVYFEAIRQLKEHCRELQEESLTTEKVADSAIDRIEIEWQIKGLAGQVKQAMIYGTPEDLGLGAMYKDFLIQYDEIIEAQEVARDVKVRKKREALWQQELLRDHRVNRAIVSVGIVAMLLWIWGFLLSLGWLVKTHSGSSLV